MDSYGGSFPHGRALRGLRLPRAQRRAQLMQAALEAFTSHGYHATGMDDIAALAGVSKPVLYQHFPGKRELYLALLDEAVDDIVRTVLAALGSGTTTQERVGATVRAYFDLVDRADSGYRLVMESDLRNDPEVQARVLAVEQRIAGAIAPLLRERMGLPEDHARVLASGVVGLAQASAQAWRRDARGLDLQEASILVADLVHQGFAGTARHVLADG